MYEERLLKKKKHLKYHEIFLLSSAQKLLALFEVHNLF